MTSKTYDLVNLDEQTVLDIVEALVKDNKPSTAFYIYQKAFPSVDWQVSYDYIKSLMNLYKIT